MKCCGRASKSAVRDIALSGDEVFVVTGPAFLGAELESLKGRVLVPTHIYKAVYVPSRNAAAAYFAPNDDEPKLGDSVHRGPGDRAWVSTCSRNLTDKCGAML